MILYFIIFFVVVVATGVFVLVIHPPHLVFNKLVLSFSGAFLFGLIFLHLLPDIYKEYDWNIGLFVLIGFILQLGLDYFSKGVEHGHYHAHTHQFPLAMFIGLCLHSFFEGMPIIHHSPDGKLLLNSSLILGIMIHKIPIVIVLASMLKQQMPRAKSFIYLVIFALTLPLGSYANIALSNFFTHRYEPIVIAVVVGIILHVSTTILYESDETHRLNYPKLTFIILGFLVAFLTS